MIWDIFSYVNLAELYLAAPNLWDSLILLTLFLGISQHVFTKKDSFGKRHGKTLAIAVSLALTFATTLFLYRQGWNLATPGMSIIPLVIIFAVLYALLYDIFTNMLGMTKMCAASLAYLLTYPGIQAMFGYPGQTFAAQQPLLGAFLNILIIIAVVAFFMCIGKLFGGNKKKGEQETTKTGGQEQSGSTKKNKETGSEPLAITVELPEQKTYPADKPIPAKASITGGTGVYSWAIQFYELTSQGLAKTNKPIHIETGKNDVAQTSLRDAQPGVYKAVFTAVDSEKNREETAVNCRVAGTKEEQADEESEQQPPAQEQEAQDQAEDEQPTHVEIAGNVFIRAGPEDKRRIAGGARGAIVQLFKADSTGHLGPVDEEYARARARGRDGAFTMQLPAERAEYSLYAQLETDQEVVGGWLASPAQTFVIDPERTPPTRLQVMIDAPPPEGEAGEQPTQETPPEEETQEPTQEPETPEEPQKSTGESSEERGETGEDQETKKGAEREFDQQEPPTLIIRPFYDYDDNDFTFGEDDPLGVYGVRFSDRVTNQTPLLFRVQRKGGYSYHNVQWYLRLGYETDGSMHWVNAGSLDGVGIALRDENSKATEARRDAYGIHMNPLPVPDLEGHSVVKVELGRANQHKTLFNLLELPPGATLHFYLMGVVQHSANQDYKVFYDENGNILDYRSRISIPDPRTTQE